MGLSRTRDTKRLPRTTEGLLYQGETLHYRITGLTPYNLDRLYITLKGY